MFMVNNYTPTRVVFGAGRLKELADIKMPGTKALICVTEDQLMEKLGIQQKVLELLNTNGIKAVVFDKVTPNPTRKGVMEALAIAEEKGCDFLIGLGGGSSIDTAKATAIMMKNSGDLWDYAYTGLAEEKK
jgi:alcohol dehydrogenase